MEVEIFGSRYDIKGDADPSYIKDLAEYIDKKMREVSQNTSTISSMRVAILAALNIADDFFTLKEECSSMTDAMNKKSDALVEMIDREILS